MEHQPTPQPIDPITEKDLAPIKILTPQQVLYLGNEFTKAEFEARSIAKKIGENPTDEGITVDLIEGFHWQSSRSSTLREILGLLGQEGMVSKIERGLSEFYQEF